MIPAENCPQGWRGVISATHGAKAGHPGGSLFAENTVRTAKEFCGR